MRGLIRPSCALVLFGMTASVGCSNSVDPFADSDGSTPFYVFGYLDTAADTQFVRVEPIRQSHDPAAGIPPSTVLTTAIGTGETVVWGDSVVALSDGTDGHLFFAPFRAVAGERYVLTAERDDGARTTASTDVPAVLPATVDTARLIANEVVQMVTWEGISVEPAGIELVYRVSFRGEPPQDVAIDYAQRGTVEAGSLTVLVRLSDDRERIAQVLGEREPDPDPALHEVALRLTILSSEWAAPDSEHVENGRGFWGAVGRFRVAWQLPPHILQRLSFSEPADAGGAIGVAKTPFL